MFDGKSFAGWEDPAKKSPPGDSFAIEDGCLKSLRASEDQRGPVHAGHLRRFRNAVRLEDFAGRQQRREVSHSGPHYARARHARQKFEDLVNLSLKNRRTDRPAKGQEYVVGFEYQALDNERHPDAKRGTIHQSGRALRHLPAGEDATRPVGEFNHSRLVVKGDHIEHWLNGEKVVDGSLKAPECGQGVGERAGARIRRSTDAGGTAEENRARFRCKTTTTRRGSRTSRSGGCKLIVDANLFRDSPTC